MPLGERLQRVHNLSLALDALRAAGASALLDKHPKAVDVPRDIAKQIADGKLEPLLAVLWSYAIELVMPAVAPAQAIDGEVGALKLTASRLGLARRAASVRSTLRASLRGSPAAGARRVPAASVRGARVRGAARRPREAADPAFQRGSPQPARQRWPARTSRSCAEPRQERSGHRPAMLEVLDSILGACLVRRERPCPPTCRPRRPPG